MGLSSPSSASSFSTHTITPATPALKREMRTALGPPEPSVGFDDLDVAGVEHLRVHGVFTEVVDAHVAELLDVVDADYLSAGGHLGWLCLASCGAPGIAC